MTDAPTIGAAEIFTLFFVMLGPLKVLGPFVQRTDGLDDRMVRQIAWRAFAIATVAIIAGSLVGRSLLAQWHISPPALMLAGGVIFLLVALRQLLEQYDPVDAAAPDPLPPAPFAAAARLVFPLLLTPYGIAAVIALLTSSDTTERTLLIETLVLAVMILNLVAMVVARRILAGFFVIVLQIVGAVLAVMQVALSVQIILMGLRAAKVIANAS
jgi:multiple antibiotic resistance protein